MSTTDAKVDALAECVLAIQRKLDELVPPNKQWRPANVRIKSEDEKPVVLDLCVSTSDGEGDSEEVSSKRSAGKTTSRHLLNLRYKNTGLLLSHALALDKIK